MIRIWLPEEWIRLAYRTAYRRHEQNQGKRAPRYGAEVQAHRGLEFHLNGMLGEAAAAFHFKIAWDTDFTRLGRYDVGRFQVRASPYKRDRWRIEVPDRDEDPFVFVRVVSIESGCVDLVGWLICREAKAMTDCFRSMRADRPGKAYWITPERMHPIETFRVEGLA